MPHSSVVPTNVNELEKLSCAFGTHGQTEQRSRLFVTWRLGDAKIVQCDGYIPDDPVHDSAVFLDRAHMVVLPPSSYAGVENGGDTLIPDGRGHSLRTLLFRRPLITLAMTHTVQQDRMTRRFAFVDFGAFAELPY